MSSRTYPRFIETKAFDAVERYALAPNGTIATTFFFARAF